MKILANTTNETIKEKTGRSWEEWLKVLNKDNASLMNHTEFASHIYKSYRVDAW